MARTRTQPGQMPGICPISSAFDFQAGSFAAAQKTRRTGIGIAGVFGAVLVAMLLLGMQAVLAARTQNSTADAAAAQTRADLAQLAKIDTAGGISADELRAHIAHRGGVYSAAVANEIDVVGLMNGIESSAPPGAQVASITFAASAASDPSAASSSTAPTGSASPSPAGSTSPAGLGQVTIKGTVNSFALIGQWQQKLAAVRGLTQINPSWSGGGQSVQVTVTASITTDGLTARARTAAQQKAGH